MRTCTPKTFVKAAREAIGQKTDVLDALVNNAAIIGGMPQAALGAGVAVFKEVFATNVLGVVQVTQAFIDLLRRAAQPSIVNVGSSGASLTLNSDPACPVLRPQPLVSRLRRSRL